MDNNYRILGVREDASFAEIKKAFREKAKKLHPDIAGAAAQVLMQKLLAAYEVLSDRQRRVEYNKVYQNRYSKHNTFNYRDFLEEQADKPEYQAKLIIYYLFNFEEDAAVKMWQGLGGVNFPLDKYLDREDWMDCSFILAEELDKRKSYYDAFMLLIDLVREERRLPYFRHFAEDVEIFLKELVRLRLRSAVNDETWIDCMQCLLELGWTPHEEARWLKSQAEALVNLGETETANAVFHEAKKRDPTTQASTVLKKVLP